MQFLMLLFMGLVAALRCNDVDQLPRMSANTIMRGDVFLGC